MAQLVKNPPAMQETWVRSLGWEYPLKKGKATHSSVLAWRIPWTVQFMESQSRTRLSDFHFHCIMDKQPLRPLKVLYLFILAVLSLLCHTRASLVPARGLCCPAVSGILVP